MGDDMPDPGKLVALSREIGRNGPYPVCVRAKVSAVSVMCVGAMIVRVSCPVDRSSSSSLPLMNWEMMARSASSTVMSLAETIVAVESSTIGTSPSYGYRSRCTDSVLQPMNRQTRMDRDRYDTRRSFIAEHSMCTMVKQDRTQGSYVTDGPYVLSATSDYGPSVIT